MALQFVVDILPTRTRLKMAGVDVVSGQGYNVAEEGNFTIENLTPFRGEPLDEFRFYAKDSEVVSQNKVVQPIVFKTEAGIPENYNLVRSMALYGTFMFTDEIAYENFFDRIIIDSIEGKGQWVIDSESVNTGNSIFWYKLHNKLKFLADEDGAQENYSVLRFYFANAAGEVGPLNTVQIDTTSLAVLTSDMLILEKNIPVYERGFSFDIEKQMVNKSFTLEVTPSIADLGMDPQNEVRINYNESGEVVYLTNGLDSFTAFNSNPNGQMTFTVRIKSATPFTVGDKIQVTLTQIDANPALVDGIQTLIFEL